MIIDNKPLHEKIAEYIRNQIIQGKLKPGEKILETQIADDLKISRTPVREAIRLLECEGFVELLPRRGAIVKEFSEKDFKDIIDIKECLETLAVELASEHFDEKLITKLENIINNEKQILKNSKGTELINKFFREESKFHETILNYCDNRHLVDLNLKINNHIKRYRFYFLKYPEILDKIPRLQENILKAIKDGDKEKLRTYYSDYVRTPNLSLLNKIKNEKD